MLRWNEGGDLLLENAVSRGDFKLSSDAVELLSLFHHPRKPADVIHEYLKKYDAEGDQNVSSSIEKLIDKFTKNGILVSDSSEDIHLSKKWYANAGVHVNMLNDQVRTQSYRQAIERVVKDKVVLELGCGSGILTFFAVKAGAKKVYAIEESKIIDLAREIAKKNGLDKRIIFIPGNSADINLPEKVDVFFTELLGTDVLEEKLLFYTRDAVKRFVKPRGVIIPSKISVCVVGVESLPVRRQVNAMEYTVQCARELSNLYGMDLSPLVDAYENEMKRHLFQNTLKGHMGDDVFNKPDSVEIKHKILTSEVTVVEYDARNLKSDRYETFNVSLPVIRNGNMNAIAMYFKAQMDDREVLTNSPFCVQTPINWNGQSTCVLEEEVLATKGSKITVQANYKPGSQQGMFFRLPHKHGRTGRRKIR